MNSTFISLIVLGAFFVFLGWRRRQLLELEGEQSKTEPNAWAKLREIVAGIFTVIGSGEYGLAFALLLAYGFFGPTFVLGLAGSLFVLSFFVPKLIGQFSVTESPWTIIDGYRNFTTPDFIFTHHGNPASSVATAITAIAFSAILVVQFVVGGALLVGITGTPYWTGVLLMALIVALYVILGGFGAIFNTDVWQGVLMWIALIGVLIYLFLFNGSSENLGTASSELWDQTISSLKNLGEDPTLISLFLATLVAAFSGPDIWQRIHMSDSVKKGKTAARYAGSTFVLFLVPLALLAIHMHAVGPYPEGSDPFIEYINLVSGTGSEAWPPLISIFFAVGLVSAFVSTADTSVMLATTAIQNEWRRLTGVSVDADRRLDRKQTIYLIIIITAICSAFAVTQPDVANQFTGVLSMLAALGVPTFLTLLGFGNKWLVFAALVLGAVISLALTFIFPDYNDGYYLLLPMIPGLLCLFRKTNSSKAQVPT